MEEAAVGPVLFFMLMGLFAVCPPHAEAKQEKAIFAGGCFWCMEPAFSGVEGVQEVKVGYTGGTVENPSYEQVSLGKTGHLEAIQIIFDPMKFHIKNCWIFFGGRLTPRTRMGNLRTGERSTKPLFFIWMPANNASRKSPNWNWIELISFPSRSPRKFCRRGLFMRPKTITSVIL